MADLDTEKPEIDVDDMDDAQLAALKEEMRGEDPRGEPQEPEKEGPATTTALTDEPAPAIEIGEKDEDDEPEGKKSETVPHGRYHQERERRKAAEAERQQLADNYAKLLERTQALLEVQQPMPQTNEPEKPGIPGPEDPVARINWTAEQLLAMQTQQAEQQQRTQAENEEREILIRVNTDLERSFQADPTIKQAHDYLRNSIGREMMALGYTQEEAVQQINESEVAHAKFVAANGRKIDEHIKNLAAARGWAPAPVEQPKPPVDQVKQIEEREETRKAALSLGKTGGGVTNTGAISPEQLLDMSDAEFDAYKKKHGSVARAFAA